MSSLTSEIHPQLPMFLDLPEFSLEDRLTYETSHTQKHPACLPPPVAQTRNCWFPSHGEGERLDSRHSFCFAQLAPPLPLVPGAMVRCAWPRKVGTHRRSQWQAGDSRGCVRVHHDFFAPSQEDAGSWLMMCRVAQQSSRHLEFGDEVP